MRRLLLGALLVAHPDFARAQRVTGTQWELRAEGYNTAALLGGAGFVVPVGTYARLGLTGAAGRYLDTPTATAARADAVARFHFDPLRQTQRTLYGAAGISVQLDQDGEWRPYLMARLGVEGRPRGRWLFAGELGLGGGAHLALVLRRARARGR